MVRYVDMKEELKKLKYLIEDRNAEMVMLDIEDMDDSIIQLESTVDSLSEEVYIYIYYIGRDDDKEE